MSPPVTPLETIAKLIKERRSIKPALMDSEREVSQDTLDALLEAARWAPTHGMTEPWRFTVFQGNARQELASTLQKLYSALTPESEFRPEKHTKLGTNPLLAPTILTISMEPGGGKISEQDDLAAVACAVQNMHLTASALGLGAFWSSPPLASSREMADYLKLSPNGKCLGLFYLGWLKPDTVWPVSPRGSIAERTTYRS